MISWDDFHLLLMRVLCCFLWCFLWFWLIGLLIVLFFLHCQYWKFAGWLWRLDGVLLALLHSSISLVAWISSLVLTDEIVFLLPWCILSSILCSPGLVVMDCLHWCLSCNVIISPSILKEHFTRHCKSWLTIIYFQGLKYIIACFLDFYGCWWER